MRTCDGCTKCCEGALHTVVNGVQIGWGKPCPLVISGVGCGIGDARPDSPCKQYRCLWLDNPDIPRGAKPDRSGLIASIKAVETTGELYVSLIKCGEVDPTMLAWFINTARDEGVNLLWIIDDDTRWQGSISFCEEMQKIGEQDGALG